MAFYNGAKIYARNHLLESNVLPYNQGIPILQKLNIDFPDIIIDVHQEPWNFSSVSGDICHMESGDRKKCNLYNLPEYDIQRIRLESKELTSVPLQNYMTPESTFYYTANGDARIVGTGVAMGNSISSLKKIAKYITETNDENGIETWINKYLL